MFLNKGPYESERYSSYIFYSFSTKLILHVPVTVLTKATSWNLKILVHFFKD